MVRDVSLRDFKTTTIYYIYSLKYGGSICVRDVYICKFYGYKYYLCVYIFCCMCLFFTWKFWLGIGGQEDMRPICGIIAAGKKDKQGKEGKVGKIYKEKRNTN